MKEIKVYCDWEIELEFKHEKQVELYIDKLPVGEVPPETIRFVCLLEPPEILNLTSQAISGLNLNTYNFLFTHNQELLDIFPSKSKLFPFASTWIKNYNFPEKKFETSTLVGGKNYTKAHSLRHKIWFKQDRLLTPNKFYLSGRQMGIENYNNNPILGDDKSPLFDSQFHICIENVKRKNWFTEKLMDCLVTKTIPIYYGCPNIDEWFDVRGFIIVDSIGDIVEACNSLTPETYENMLEYVEINFEKSKKYTTINDRLVDEIKKILKNE